MSGKKCKNTNRKWAKTLEKVAAKDLAVKICKQKWKRVQKGFHQSIRSPSLIGKVFKVGSQIYCCDASELDKYFSTKVFRWFLELVSVCFLTSWSTCCMLVSQQVRKSRAWVFAKFVPSFTANTSPTARLTEDRKMCRQPTILCSSLPNLKIGQLCHVPLRFHHKNP